MPKVTSHKVDEVHKSIMGGSLKAEPKQGRAEATASPIDTPLPGMEDLTKPAKKSDTENYIQDGFYITPKQKKALKLRAAMSNRVEDKDKSAIVRAMLDTYLADELKQVR
jgi:hypothetical protein